MRACDRDLEAGAAGGRMNAVSRASCIEELVTRLGVENVLTDNAEMAKYQTAARYDDGKAAFVVRPRDVDSISAAVAICRRHGVTLIPQGANTGLVGAAVPGPAGADGVLSLDRLAREITLDLPNRSVRVSAGVLLSDLNTELEKHGLACPIDLGADPSIGGMVATRGWADESTVPVVDLARRFEDAGVAALLFTDVGRDGLLKGCNVEATVDLARAVRIPVIASGGVKGIGDIRALSWYAKDGVEGVITGRALYDGRLDLATALAIAAAAQ